MGQIASSSTGGRVATSVIGGVVAAPISYVVGKIVEKWGILDPLADRVGEWLQINVPASAVGWSVAVVLFAALYGLFLSRVWGHRHTYDVEREHRFGVGDSAEAELIPAGARKFVLTGAERERASAALCAVVDFLGSEMTPFYNTLSELDAAGPWNIVDAADGLEQPRQRLSGLANELWHKHSYLLEIMHLDIMPLLQTLEALRNPLQDAAEAVGWPVNAQADRARPVTQLMSDLGGLIGNMRREAVEKRKEYLE